MIGMERKLTRGGRRMKKHELKEEEKEKKSKAR
jgi:hypothetical protein